MPTEQTALDFDARYQVDSWPGVAVYIHGWPQKFVPFEYQEEDEDGNTYWVETPDGEWEDNPDAGRIVVVMVGDDHKFEVDTDALTLLEEDGYCFGCGQIGCGH